MSSSEDLASLGGTPVTRVTRRKLLAGAGLLASVGLLGACSSSPAASPTTASQPTQAPKTEPTKAPAAATQAPQAAAKPTEAAKPAASAVPAVQGKKGGKVTWALEQDPVHLIPFGAVPTANQWGKEFMYDSLLEWDRNLKVQPALAESYETPDDKTFVFKLRKGVKFHDGSEVTAEDVKYSFELQKSPPAPGIKIPFYPKIDNVEVLDKYTAKFNMTGVDPTLIGYIAWSRYSPVVPKGLYDKVNVLKEGIGTGPFKLVEYVPNDHVTYKRNPDFWKPGFPYLDDLDLKILPDEQSRVAALRSGAIDGATVSADVARTLKNDRSLVILKGLFAAHREIQFVMKGEKKPWHDKRVRQAINFAINRQDIVDKVYGGEAELSGEIPPGYGDWTLPKADLQEKYLAFNLDKAKGLMKDAGFADGFKVTLQSIAQPRDITQAAEIVKEHLKAINIDVTVQPLEIGTFAKNNGEGSFEWQLTARGMRGDPDGYVHEFEPSGTQFKNWFGENWKNDELTKLINDALLTVDQQKRLGMYRRMQEILMDELPHITLVQPYKYQVVRTRLKNMYVSYTDFNTGLREVWVEG